MRSVLMTAVFVVATFPESAGAQPEKPNVAILVYDGVQVIDHAIPYEVLRADAGGAPRPAGRARRSGAP